jgi:hypothetical protein
MLLHAKFLNTLSDRAYEVFCRHILPIKDDRYAELRKGLRRVHNLPLPEHPDDPPLSARQIRQCFGEFLKFLKFNLAGQTALDTAPHARWTQIFALHQGRDNTITIHTIDLRRHGGEILEQTFFAAHRLRATHGIGMNNFQ